MADLPDAGTFDHGSALVVAVRRPLHRPNPFGRLVGRWRLRRDRRRAARLERTARGERTRWWEVFDVPFGELDAFAAMMLAIATVAVVVLAAVFAGPFLWILILFVVDLVLWVLLALAGGAAWLLLGRPWRVVVVDHTGATVGSAQVRGRKRAHEHAAVVRTRLAGGLEPESAVRHA